MHLSNSLRKRTTRFLALAVVTALALTTMAVESEKPKGKQEAPEKPASSGIEWLKYEQGLKKAKAEDKHIFIDFSTSWCGWCKKMDRETFSEPKVIKIVNDNFIAVKVDGDSKREMDIDGYKITEKNLTRREYQVRGYPAFWFLKPDGTKLAQIRGYKPAAYMINAFEYILDKKYDSTSTDDKDESPSN